MDVLPELSLGTAALIVFALCAGYILLRGVARTFINSAFLLVAVWVGFRVWQQAPALAIEWFGKSSQIITIGLPALAAIITLIVLKKAFSAIFKSPFEHSENEAPKPLPIRLAFALIPAILICITAATFLNHAGAVAELKNSVESGTESKASLPQRIKNSISFAIPESLMEKLDPLSSQPRLQLAKIIASQQEESPQPILDPETGKPYPRAIIVNEPELTALAEKGEFSTLLRHPALTKALKDPRIRKALELE